MNGELNRKTMSHLVLFSAHSVTVCSLQHSHAHTCTHTYAFIHTVTYTRTHTYTHAHICMFPVSTSLNLMLSSLSVQGPRFFMSGVGGTPGSLSSLSVVDLSENKEEGY